MRDYKAKSQVEKKGENFLLLKCTQDEAYTRLSLHMESVQKGRKKSKTGHFISV